MKPYAYGTDVSPEKSRAEIEALLRKYGAKSFASGWSEGSARIVFEAHNRHVRFLLTFAAGDGMSASQYAAEERRRWRSLLLVIKAKLEAVATGITTFENEFLAHIVLPGGETVGDKILSAIEQQYRDGKVAPLLLGPGPT